jgi:Adenylate and Guanylate cyclase catalytic domain
VTNRIVLSKSDRCRALVLYGTFARFASWCPTEEAFAGMLNYIDQSWGSGGLATFFANSRANDPAFVRWFGRFERLGASPASAAALMRMNSQIDISDIVSTIRVPTLVVHRTDDKAINVEGGRFLARNIPGARYIELPGVDHAPMIGDNADEIADAIQEFLTGARAPVEVDRVLSTVLFTDIVGSTEKAAALGDRRWRDLLDKHHGLIRTDLARFRGREVKTTGDGILATFDGPARGVRCACAIAEEVKPLGIEVRAGPSLVWQLDVLTTGTSRPQSSRFGRRKCALRGQRCQRTFYTFLAADMFRPQAKPPGGLS